MHASDPGAERDAVPRPGRRRRLAVGAALGAGLLTCLALAAAALTGGPGAPVSDPADAQATLPIGTDWPVDWQAGWQAAGWEAAGSWAGDPGCAPDAWATSARAAGTWGIRAWGTGAWGTGAWGTVPAATAAEVRTAVLTRLPGATVRWVGPDGAGGFLARADTADGRTVSVHLAAGPDAGSPLAAVDVLPTC